jgi:transposase
MLDLLSFKEQEKLLKEMSSIIDEPDFRKIPALLWRITLLKLEKLNRKNQHKKGMIEFYRSFCDTNGISLATLYRKMKSFRQYGINGLMPAYQRNRIHTRKIDDVEYLEIPYRIDLKHPIESILEIVNTVSDSKQIDASKRELLKIVSSFLGSIKGIRGTNNALKIRRTLNENELETVHHLKGSIHRNVSQRAIVVDMFLHNEPLSEIVRKSKRNVKTIYRWKSRFESEGIKFLSIKRNRGPIMALMEERKNRIAKIIHYPPNHYDINRSSWTLITLAEVYQKEHKEKISPTSVSRAIKEMGYTFKKARKVLTSEDPQYREKVMAIKKVKSSLKETDALFFIDEAGPWAVKPYGGKSIHAPGEIKTYPQYPPKKGSITFIGAYEATNKIILWKFISHKDSEGVIEILKMILHYAHHKKQVYVVWDSASWHDSNSLHDFIESHNASNEPEIIVLPLPSKAQYLNTIESYFSGMKKAIIHNSDFRSSDEMIAAIVRYFREKNLRNLKKYFDENNVETDFESGLHKKIN